VPPRYDPHVHFIYAVLLSPQAVVLAHRPPISIPRTTVAPALLEELLGEISNLASVYHKPEETFVGRGRVGADSMQRKGTEYGLIVDVLSL
jgi:hypothetical protein